MTNYYVSRTGNNAAAGTTTATAWATIARAGSAGAITTAGDIVNVLPGTWSLSGFTTAKPNITYRSTVQWGAALAGLGSGTTASSILWTNTGDGVTIDGFDVSHHGRIGIFAHADNNEVMNCYVHDIMCQGTVGGSGGAGINCDGSGVYVHENLVVRVDPNKSVPNTVQGIYLQNAFMRVYNNIVGDISSVGVNNNHAATNAYIVNNTIFNCKIGIWVAQDDAGAGAGSKNNFIANNIIYGSTAVAVRATQGVTGTGSNIYKNNCLWNNALGLDLTSTDIAVGNFSADPRFVAYDPLGNGDYHLSSNSACINAGVNSGSASLGNVVMPVIDFEGNVRPNGASRDVGAYEFGSVADTTPPNLTLASATATGQTTAFASVTTDEGGRILYCYTTVNATETASAIILNGQSASITTASGKTFGVTGLDPATTYRCHFTQVDNAGNTATVVSSNAFTTSGTVLPSDPGVLESNRGFRRALRR